LITLAVIILIAVLAALASPHFYFFKQVSPEQVGIKIRGGQIVDIVPPGVYSDVGLFVKLETYSTAAYQFTVEDPEVLTQDQQRVGVRVSGSVFRPNSTNEKEIQALWGQYRSVFLSDASLQGVMNDLAMQAMKVCVGDRPFIESVVGSSRDAVRNCVDDVLNELVKPYGLAVANITVPNVTLSP
jgi:regulator of protease activity HflC (stomatin/prohibitin superfamily)